MFLAESTSCGRKQYLWEESSSRGVRVYGFTSCISTLASLCNQHLQAVAEEEYYASQPWLAIEEHVKDTKRLFSNINN